MNAEAIRPKPCAMPKGWVAGCENYERCAEGLLLAGGLRCVQWRINSDPKLGPDPNSGEIQNSGRPIGDEDVDFVRGLGVAIGDKDNLFSIGRKLWEGAEAAGEGDAFKLLSIAIDGV
jgi:hypothetical protein